MTVSSRNVPDVAASAGPGGDNFADVAATRPEPWPQRPRRLEVRIAGAGRLLDLDDFLATTTTTSLVVVVDGELVTERYFRGHTAATPVLGHSATKSVLALLVGASDLNEDDPARRWVPELDGTAYAEVTVRHLLSMTSGVGWVEDHRDPDRLASRLSRSGPVRDLLREVPAGRPPGTAFTYCTADSLVLDWVRERATGLDFTTHLGELWDAVGAEHPATVGLDGPGGVARAGGALAATPRDWARLGWLQIDGRWGDRQVVPRPWADASSRPGAPFLRPGRLPSTITTHAGFGYHWWPLDDSGCRVTADGMLGQFVYVDRPRRTVVVKTSAWPYEDAWADRQCRDLTYLALPAIAEAALPGIDAPLALYETAVRPEWIDYNGHLTESGYLLVFGDSSDALFRFVGIDEAYRAAGHSLYTVETHLHNLREVAEGEPLRLTLQLLDADGKRLHLFHAMHHGRTGELLATAEQLLLHVDMTAGRVAPLPPVLAARLAAIREAHAHLPVPDRVGRPISMRRRA